MIFLRLGIFALAPLLLSGCATGQKISESPATLERQKQYAQQQIFTVEGCVHHPGKFFLKPGHTLKLSEALKMAGGTIDGNYFAGERAASLFGIRVRRLRDGSIVEFKLDARTGKSGNDFLIQSGDSIHVPELF